MKSAVAVAMHRTLDKVQRMPRVARYACGMRNWECLRSWKCHLYR